MMHKEHIVTFLNAGKHVLCEKPLALEQSDLNEIVAAVKAHPECKFMVGQICRFTPAFKMAKEIIESGRVGEIYFVESEYAHDYEAIFNDPTRQWRADPKRHGVIGGGCHAVDLLRWLVGGDPYDIHAYGTHKMLKQLPYDDSTLAIMKFPGGIMGKVFVSTGCKRGYTMRTLVYGTKGTLIFDNRSDTMTFFEVNPEDPNHKAEEKIIPVDINNHNAASEFKTFADHILNDTPVTTDVYEGAKTAAACITIVESSMKDGAVLTPDYNFGM
jgi:predicted dehydrogenase